MYLNLYIFLPLLQLLNISVRTAATTAPAPVGTISTTLASSLPCKHPHNSWGAADPNIYFVCDGRTNTSLQLHCPEGRGYFNGLGYSGCIPYDEWPACISVANRVQLCDAEHLMQPWETVNPNKFYMCQVELQEPLLVNCEAGKGFMNVLINNGGSGATTNVVGCAIWEKWRSYMKCEHYY